MSVKCIKFECINAPDNTALKAQLSVIPGVVEMNINSKTNAVDVAYDDTLVSDSRISACLQAINYQIKN